jgi:RTX calcium-binding nonapeptide repeat (4 copies)
LIFSVFKLVAPIGIILLGNALVPLTANALPINGGDGFSLPIPSHFSVASPSNRESNSSASSNIHSYPWANENQYMPKDATSGLNIPKNLIVPRACLQKCPTIIGTQKDDIIIATAVTDATIYGLGGNDIIQCGSGQCKAYGGSGDNVLISGSSSSAQLYGGSGNNIFIGGAGDTLMVGGKGNDQFYAGSGHDVMIGGGGANYFDCGPNGNGVILDFNAKNGDTKASNCKFVVTVQTGVQSPP